MVPLSCCIDMYFRSPTQDISIMTMLRGVRMDPCTDIGLSGGEKRRGGALTGVDQCLRARISYVTHPVSRPLEGASSQFSRITEVSASQRMRS